MLLVALVQPEERLGASDGLLSAPAIHPLRPLIPDRDAPVGVARHDRVLDVIQQRAEVRQLFC
jgi:hypothetical protein